MNMFAPQNSPAKIKSISDISFGDTLYCPARFDAQRPATGRVIGFSLGSESKLTVQFSDGDVVKLDYLFFQYV